MAKRCLSGLVVDGVYYPLMQINDFSICTDGWEVKLSSSLPSYVTSLGSNLYEDAFNREWAAIGEPITKYILGNNAFLRVYDYNSSGNGNTFNLQMVGYPTLGFCQEGMVYSERNTAFWHICIVVDDDTELAWAFHYESTGLWKYAPGDETKHLLYEALVEAFLSGGAGSGYIGNSLLSNKKMVGYNVPTSSAEGTKTESVNEVSASAVSGKPKSGNGFARIKFLRELYNKSLIEIVKTQNLDNTKKTSPTSSISDLSEYFLTNNILYAVESNDYCNLLTSFDGSEGKTAGKSGENQSYQGNPYRYGRTGALCFIPINRINIVGLSLKLKFDVFCGQTNTDEGKQYNYCNFGFARVENGNMIRDSWLIQTTFLQLKNYTSSYLTLSVDLNTPVTADYFVVLGFDGGYDFKDVVFTVA